VATWTSRVVAAAAVLALLAPGCGGGGGSEGLDATLRYFPADTAALVVISTDLEGPQFKELDRIVFERAHRHIESFLRGAVESAGFSWDEEVKPLLGHELVVGTPLAPGVGGGGFGSIVAALHTNDGGKLKQAFERSKRFKKAGEASGVQLYRDREDGEPLAIDGDVLLSALSELSLRDALALARAKEHLTEEKFRARLSGLPSDALVQVYGDASALLSIPRVTPLRQIPWIDALRTRSPTAVRSWTSGSTPRGSG
jgi:hypothetical protein